MSAITTHVLDLSAGEPARGVHVTLSRLEGNDTWADLGDGHTDLDGRANALLPEGMSLAAGVYRLRFALGAYFSSRGVDTFYPEAAVAFAVRDASEHYHVPLLVSPFGYSTYRGS